MIPKLQFLCIWVTLDLVLPVLVQRLVPLEPEAESGRNDKDVSCQFNLFTNELGQNGRIEMDIKTE